MANAKSQPINNKSVENQKYAVPARLKTILLFRYQHPSTLQYYLPSQSPDAVIVVMVENLERTNLGCISDVCTYACAGVIIPYPDYPEGLRGIFR